MTLTERMTEAERIAERAARRMLMNATDRNTLVNHCIAAAASTGCASQDTYMRAAMTLARKARRDI